MSTSSSSPSSSSSLGTPACRSYSPASPKMSSSGSSAGNEATGAEALTFATGSTFTDVDSTLFSSDFGPVAAGAPGSSFLTATFFFFFFFRSPGAGGSSLRAPIDLNLMVSPTTTLSCNAVTYTFAELLLPWLLPILVPRRRVCFCAESAHHLIQLLVPVQFPFPLQLGFPLSEQRVIQPFDQYGVSGVSTEILACLLDLRGLRL